MQTRISTAPVAQWIACGPPKTKAVGSSPTWGSFWFEEMSDTSSDSFDARITDFQQLNAHIDVIQETIYRLLRRGNREWIRIVNLIKNILIINKAHYAFVEQAIKEINLGQQKILTEISQLRSELKTIAEKNKPIQWFDEDALSIESAY